MPIAGSSTRQIPERTRANAPGSRGQQRGEGMEIVNSVYPVMCSSGGQLAMLALSIIGIAILLSWIFDKIPESNHTKP